jgi:hypothetical protein
MPFIIKASGNDQLVQLVLTLKEDTGSTKEQGFVLEGVYNKKQAYLKTTAPAAELSPVFMP